MVAVISLGQLPGVKMAGGTDFLSLLQRKVHNCPAYRESPKLFHIASSRIASGLSSQFLCRYPFPLACAFLTQSPKCGGHPSHESDAAEMNERLTQLRCSALLSFRTVLRLRSPIARVTGLLAYRGRSHGGTLHCPSSLLNPTVSNRAGMVTPLRRNR